MTKLTSPLIGLLFLQRNSTILDMRQGILKFPFFSMQLKNEDRTYPNVIEPIINPVDTILQQGQRTTIWVKSQIYTKNEATGKIQSSPLLENDEDLLLCPAISLTQNNKHMVQISNFLDHLYTLKKGTHIATFSILTPEQTKHTRPVNPTSMRHLLNNNHDDVIHYINSLLKTSKIDEVNETYWFPTPKNPGNEKEHTPIQARILNELRELEQLEKLNPLENTESRNQFLSNFDWTNSTLQPNAKQAVENLLVEFHDIFARHRFDIGINTEFKVQLTTLDNRPAYSQSLPAPTNLKDDILVELALLHKYGIITTLRFSNMLVQYLHKGNQTGNYAFWLTSEKLIHLLQMITSTTTIRSAHKRMQHSIWLGKTCSANLIVPRHITAFKWPTSNQLNSLHSTLQVGHLQPEGWHKD